MGDGGAQGGGTFLHQLKFSAVGRKPTLKLQLASLGSPYFLDSGRGIGKHSWSKDFWVFVYQ